MCYVSARLTCESVFTIQNSTPSSSLMIIRLTALEPPPPTPMTCDAWDDQAMSKDRGMVEGWPCALGCQHT